MVEADWPPLTLTEVRKVLTRYPDAGAPIDILSVSPRPFSAASVVSTAAGRVFIKRHHRQVRDCEGLFEEHRFIEHLRARGVPVPRVIADQDGQTAIALDEWTYEVHEPAAGLDLYADAHSWTPFQSIGHAGAAGRLLAELHRAAQSFSAPPRKLRPLVASFTIFAAADPQTQLEEYLKRRPALAADHSVRDACAEALRLLAPFHDELRPHLPDLGSTWTHNDLHASNLFWSDGDGGAHATAVIDFGLADRTCAIHDLALAIERSCVEWLALTRRPATFDAVPVHFEALRAFLDAYASMRTLRHAECAALAPMLALCHAEFALSEADYFLGVLHSMEKARMAVPEYLVGHAEWFRSPSGAHLLNRVREWADKQINNGERPQ